MSKIVLWASDVQSQAVFYSRLFDVEVPQIEANFAEVSDGTNSVLLHGLPTEYASETSLTTPLPVQDDVAIKPVFTVSSIDEAVIRIASTLAVIDPQRSLYESYEYQDLIDPEGNRIQIQQTHLT
ncbi:MAG: hypothetical protein RL142_586 [Actinomycetota bacterium]|jgi:predicted enzyme related to lactoylglutathione lyase